MKLEQNGRYCMSHSQLGLIITMLGRRLNKLAILGLLTFRRASRYSLRTDSTF